MFEYLMPLLVMPNYENTLLDHTCKAAVQQQIAYGHLRVATVWVALAPSSQSRKGWSMSKNKAGGTFPGRDPKGAPANPPPQAQQRRPMMPSPPHVAPRTRKSPKGR
jgi:hypothetical protein